MKKILITVILIVFAGLYLSVSGDSLEYKKKAEEALNRAREFQKKTRELSSEMKEFEKNSARRIERRKDEIKDLQKEITELKRELGRETARKQGRQRALRELALKFETLREDTENSMKGYDRSIEESLPFERENRSLILHKIITDASYQSVNPEEVYHRYHDFLRKEYLRGFDSEAYTDGENACVRVGWVILACLDGSGDRAWMFVRDKGRWRKKSDLTMAQSRAVKDAVRMLQGKKSPSLVEFPVPAGLFTASAREGSDE